MTDPTTQQNTSFSYPTRTKIVIVVVLILAVGGFVVAGLSTDTDISDDIAVTGNGGTGNETGGGQTDDPDGVIRTTPRDGAQTLAQQELRLQLSPGWTGELTFVPSSGVALPLPADEVETTALNELVYVPDDGRTIERLPSGRNCVNATIWDQVEGREATERRHSWCFDVT